MARLSNPRRRGLSKLEAESIRNDALNPTEAGSPQTKRSPGFFVCNEMTAAENISESMKGGEKGSGETADQPRAEAFAPGAIGEKFRCSLL